MTHPAKTSTAVRTGRLRLSLLSFTLALLGLALPGAAPASASKQVIGYIGSGIDGQGGSGGQFKFSTGVAVNNSGAGPADQGDIYVADDQNRRIQRFGHDDNGTPANLFDDSYPFISAWGAGVESGGSSYEVCTVATSCRPGNARGGNGALARVGGVGVDQDTGDVYASDPVNNRINVYDGSGVFLRSFGWDVVQSGPDDTGTAYEVCVASKGDVCKAGLPGAGTGQIGGFEVSNDHPARGIALSPPDGNPATGTVFLADAKNHRINTYKLDGSAPGSFGSVAAFGSLTPERPDAIAVDADGIVYASSSLNHSEIERYDSENANGGGVGFLAPIPAPPLSDTTFSDSQSLSTGFATDLSSGALYVRRRNQSGQNIVQFGPANPPGLISPPSAFDDVHGESAELGGGELFDEYSSLALDESSGNVYAPSQGGGTRAEGVYVLNNRPGGPAATASFDSLSDITSHSATVHATVNPNGGPASTSYHLEYSTDGTHWASTREVAVGSQETPQPVEALLEPFLGLEPNTTYHVRLVAQKRFLLPVTTAAQTFTTLPGPPLAETTGSPVRSATTALLGGRVAPRNSATTYHFEYGAQGPCDSNPCTATEARDVGSGGVFVLVAQQLEGLEPGTTYHYRVVADNGNAGSPVFGEDMTVRTRENEAPLGHGHFPGPPGSDRAWEQVSSPDSGGNPVQIAAGISDDGSRVLYSVSGGTPDSTSANSFANRLFAERTPGGWKTKAVFPGRGQAAGSNWSQAAGRSDLAEFVSGNFNPSGAESSEASIWRLFPDKAPSKIIGVEKSQYFSTNLVSGDASRVLAVLVGSMDPNHPTAPLAQNLYDVSSGSPHLISSMPDGSVPDCGVDTQVGGLTVSRYSHSVSADGSWAFFPSKGGGQSCASAPDLLYAHDLETETTKAVSSPPVGGRQCSAGMIKSTPGALFFLTNTRLVAEDSEPGRCENGSADVYRYDLGDGSLDCVTCVVPGLNANVEGALDGRSDAGYVGVSEDGSRVYFTSFSRLVPGAAVPGSYRVDVATGDLAYIGDLPASSIANGELKALTPDGAVAAFLGSGASLNPIGGQQNGGNQQYYRYDDRDGSLICVSCPTDGSAPSGGAGGGVPVNVGPNMTFLDDAGDVVFTTTTPLAGADQNTAGAGQPAAAGQDVYEWRDGRQLLITDGLLNWPVRNGSTAPSVAGITPSGRDVFFTEAAQLTADALDGYTRLYDARIGGGIEFPRPPKPCPLEVCQGTPKGAPEEAAPGTGAFAGPGNAQPARKGQARCAKGNRKARKGGKARCVKAHQAKHRHKANNDRRASR